VTVNMGLAGIDVLLPKRRSDGPAPIPAVIANAMFTEKARRASMSFSSLLRTTEPRREVSTDDRGGSRA